MKTKMGKKEKDRVLMRSVKFHGGKPSIGIEELRGYTLHMEIMDLETNSTRLWRR